MSEPTLPDPVTEPGSPAASETPTSTTATGKPVKPPRRIQIKDVVAIVLVVVIVIFIAENGDKTDIRFVGPQVNTYLWLALLISAAFGFVLGVAVAWQRGRTRRKAQERH